MSPVQYDILIRGASIIDGTGAPAQSGDVAVTDGRIAALGDVEGDAGRVIDAGGMAVAPGFIDVHTHDDVALLSNPRLDFKAMQGVTTVVCGNCGAGAAPANERGREFYRLGVEGILGPVTDFSWQSLPEFYDAVRAVQPAVNVAFLVPHGPLRVVAMGWERRAPSERELEVMKEHLAEGMAAGAVGLSTGLIYPPSMFADTEELIELSRVVARFGGLYASHIRDEGGGLLEAVAEAIRIGEEGGVPVQISHHKASGRENWGLTEQSLPLIEQARERGVDVTIDAYPYTAGSTALGALAGGGRVGRIMEPNSVLIASVKHQHQYEGKRLDEVAAMMDLPVEEATSRLLQEEENAVVAVLFIMEEGDVRRVLSHPTCMVGSDGIPSPTGKPHPRLYGTFPRILGRYVREEGLLSLEEAVHRMTSMPAAKFGLADRGVLRQGAWADLVVFDPQQIADTATYDDPRRYPTGIACVVVNGEVIIEDGAQSGTAAGKVLARA